jgi:shikimate 5-dehydrogenase
MSAGEVMGFVGVSTGQSSIRRVFPSWAAILGLPAARLVGHDLPPGAPDERYREVIRTIRDDDRYAGALITTHKIGVYRSAGSLFDVLDEFAAQCGEISSVSKRDGKLIGHAKDPLTAGLSMEEFLTPDYFARTGAHVLCLGAGGAGTAITWYLSRRDDRPERITCTALRPESLAELRAVLARAGIDAGGVRTVLADGPADDLLTGLPPGSLVINATGLGKDQPGSPITGDARFPDNGIAWELNYRGSLEFLHQARSAPPGTNLTIVDGWRYFIHGWSQVVAEVFDLRLTPPLVERLADAAAALR